MRTKLQAIILMLCICAPSFFVITTTVQSIPRLLQANDLYGSTDEPYVAAELIDEECFCCFEQLDYTTSIPWWYDLVDKEDVPNNGAGVYVAVLDTGLLSNWDFFFPEANIAWELGKGFSHDIYWDDEYGLVIGELRDDRGFITGLASGHGTHVTSTITGFYVPIGEGVYVEGLAPLATIIPVLCLDAWEVVTPWGEIIQLSGGTDEMITAAILYVADLADSLDAPVVINMSLGGPTPTPMIEEAIDYAIEQGVIVVVSAGNEGEAGMGWPGAYDQVISCAACGWTEMFYHEWGGDWFYDGVLADVPEKLNTPDVLGNEYQVYLEDFSGRPNPELGQKDSDLDVMAPGAWILGPYKPSFSPSVGYYYVSGTSMAAPQVSAMAALILEIFPFYEQEDIEWILKCAASGKKANEKRGFPATGTDVLVAYYLPGYVYVVSWDENDFGKGFLKANNAIMTAAFYLLKYLFKHWF